MMNQFSLNKDGSIEQDRVFLVDRLFNLIGSGEIYPIDDLKVIANLNENWECSFTVYRETDGVKNPLWDKIQDLSLVKIENKGIFELEAPITDEECTYKQCVGKSICETETSQSYITLEVNTENDIARESKDDPTFTYYKEFPTVLYRDIKDLTVFEKLKQNNTDNTVENSTDNTTVDNSAAKFDALSDNQKKEILRRSSLLHRVFSEMPEYLANIDGEKIDKSLKNTKRVPVFSWDNTSVYDICQDIATELQCIFIFDRFSRSFEVRDLKEHCEIDGCRDIKDGICPVCEKNGTTQHIRSFGEYSGVEIDTKNLAETIQLSGDKDAVKNYFKIEGADDVITNRISNRMIGNGYIWKVGTLQKSQMSKELVDALESREAMIEYNDYESKYNDLWDEWNHLDNKILHYRSGMMPSPETAEHNADYVFNYLFGEDGKIDYAYASNQFQPARQIADSVMNYAKLLSPTNHTIEYIKLSLKHTETKWNNCDVVDTISFKVHIYLDGHYIENDETKGYADEYTSETITLEVCKGYDITYTEGENKGIYTTDYYNYLKHLIDTANAKSDITDEVITFDPETLCDIEPDAESYQNIPLKSTHYSKYCLKRLYSFYKAYEACSIVIAGKNDKIASDTSSVGNDTTSSDATDTDTQENEASSESSDVVNILDYLKPDGSIGNIREDLLGKYGQYMELLSARMQWLEEQIKNMEEQQASLMKRINEIKEICDMENCIKQYMEEYNIDRNLWYELCSFKRQDTYKNDNFIGEGMNDADLMKNVEDLIKRAEEEIDSACNITYSATATIGNLLVMPEFERFWDKFALGNYIHMVIDDKVHTMRLVSITYDYSDLSHCPVEFSEIVKKEMSETDKVKNVLSKAAALTTSAKTIARQAESGAEAKLTVNTIKNDALNIANSKIITADSQDFVLDKYGLTGKYTDPISGEVSGQQVRLINNMLCFTDDGWQHTRSALGEITYINPETREYETRYGLIADSIIGNLVMSERLYISDGNGTTLMDGNGIKVTNGYLYLTNDNNVIEINPKKDSLFTISKKSDNSNIITLDSNGNATFTGTINAKDGMFSGDISGASGTFGTGDYAITLDDNGISSQYFNIDKDGAWFTGTIAAEDGVFSGDISGASGTFGTGDYAITLDDNGISSQYFNINKDDGASFDGKITAGPGSKIGDLSVGENKLTYKNFGIATPSDTDGKVALWVGSKYSTTAPFRVKHDGSFIAENATIKGEIEAHNGYIGSSENGWTISDNAIYNGCESFSSTKNGTYIGTDGIRSVDREDAIKYINIENGTIASGTNGFNKTTISGGVVTVKTILDDYNTAGIFVENTALFPGQDSYATTIRANYIDFTRNGKEKRAATGWIFDGTDKETAVGFYLINNSNKVSGSFEMGAGSNSSTLQCDNISTSTGTINSSDARLKKDISTIEDSAVDFILGLKPKKYKLKNGTSGRYHYGFLAQEVEEIMNDTVGDVGVLIKQEKKRKVDEEAIAVDFNDDDTFQYALRYEEMIAPMVETIQKLHEEINELKAEMARIKQKKTI